ncbi:MAG: YkvA family protein [Spirosomataceae bacterium]
MSTKNSSLIEQILTSIFYKRSKGKAGKILQDPSGLLNLLKNVFTKANNNGSGGNNTLSDIRAKLTSVVSLVRNYASGEYRDVSRGSIISVVAALIYFVSPLDCVPDFIPVLGFADDLALLTFVISKLGNELEKFQLWEMNKDLNN